MKTTLIVVLLVASSCLAEGSFKGLQITEEQVESLFNRVDEDKDGILTSNEIHSFIGNAIRMEKLMAIKEIKTALEDKQLSPEEKRIIKKVAALRLVQEKHRLAEDIKAMFYLRNKKTAKNAKPVIKAMVLERLIRFGKQHPNEIKSLMELIHDRKEAAATSAKVNIAEKIAGLKKPMRTPTSQVPMLWLFVADANHDGHITKGEVYQLITRIKRDLMLATNLRNKIGELIKQDDSA